MRGQERRWLRICGALLLLGSAVLSRTALAEPLPPRLDAAAQQHLASGRAALGKADVPRALRELELAYEQGAGPEALGLLGQVAVRQEQRTRAADLYRRYLNDAGGTSEEAAPLLALIESEQGTAAEISVFGPPGALLRVDDRIVGRLPLSTRLLLAPGPRKLKLAFASWPQPKEQELQAVSGRPVSVRFTEDGTTVIVTQTPAVLVLYDQSARPPASATLVVRALLEKVHQDGQAYDLPAERSAQAVRSEAPGCVNDPLCLRRLARKLSVDYVLHLKPSAPRYALQVVDIAVDIPPAPPQIVDCADRAEPACAAAVGEVVSALLTASLSRQHGRVSISSSPDGARIAVDVQQLTLLTPAELTLTAGDAQITLRKPGYATQQQPVMVAVDGTTPLQFVLAVNVAAARRHRFAIGTRLLAVSAALAIAGGVVAIGCNGLQRTVDSDPTHYQELLSWPHGLVAIGAGLVFGGVSIWMYRKQRAAAAEAQAAEW